MMTKNVRNVFVMLGVTLLAVLGFAAMTSPAQAKAPVAAVAAATATPTPTTPVLKRDWCIKVGTGELRNLWLTPAGKCPVYTPKTDEYWGPVKLGEKGDPGPAGPAGPAGPNSLVFGHAEKVIGADGSWDLTISGQPALTSLVKSRTLVTKNDGAVPGGGTVTVTDASVANSTSRTFHVVATGFTGATPDFTLTVDTLTVVGPAS